MRKRFWWERMALLTVFLAAIVLVSPQLAGAVAGDADNDGVPDQYEDYIGMDPMSADSDYDGLLDGWEDAVTGTNPLDADTDGDVGGTIDSLENSDAGVIPDGMELANGADPLNEFDDDKLFPVSLTMPLPGVPDTEPFEPVEVPRTQPIVVDWTASPTAFYRYVIQFDDSPRFESPVNVKFTPITQQKLALEVINKWPAITRQGRVVYVRVLGFVAGTDRRVSSNIAPVVITEGPELLGPADEAKISPKSPPTFAWTGMPGLNKFCLIVNGSHKLGTESIRIPGNGWITEKTFTPGRRLWRRITALGDEISWQVVGKDRSGRYGYSEARSIILSGGAEASIIYTAPPVSPVPPDPDVIPDFNVNQGDSGRYKILFSGSENFSDPGFAYPVDGTWAYFPEGGEAVYAPSEADWNTITSLGSTIFWTVKGKYRRRYFTYSPIQTYQLGESIIINELTEGVVNRIDPPLPQFTFGGSASTGYQVVFGVNPRMSGPSAVSPSDGMLVDPAWDMPMNFAAEVADLNRNFVFMRVRGTTAAGNSRYSPAYALRTLYLRSPILNDVGARVDKSVTYTVSWEASPDDNGQDVLYYQLQEATNRLFTRNLRSFNVDGLSRDFKHSEVNGRAVFFYRVRAVNSVGHSAWSNRDKKKVTGEVLPQDPLLYKKVGAPFDPNQAGNYIIDDENNYNSPDVGRIDYEGPGWLVWGGGYNGSYHYMTRSTQNGSETATWTPNLQRAGNYEVWVSWRCTSNRADAAYYYVVCAEGTFLFKVNQRIGGSGFDPTWAKLGNFTFDAGRTGYVKLINGPSHSEAADAAGFKFTGN